MSVTDGYKLCKIAGKFNFVQQKVDKFEKNFFGLSDTDLLVHRWCQVVHIYIYIYMYRVWLKVSTVIPHLYDLLCWDYKQEANVTDNKLYKSVFILSRKYTSPVPVPS